MDWNKSPVRFIRKLLSKDNVNQRTTTIGSNAASFERNARATLRKTFIVCGALTLILILISIIAATIGSERQPLVDLLRALVTGGPNAGAFPATQRAILFDIRLPRILLAA